MKQSKWTNVLGIILMRSMAKFLTVEEGFMIESELRKGEMEKTGELLATLIL